MSIYGGGKKKEPLGNWSNKLDNHVYSQLIMLKNVVQCLENFNHFLSFKIEVGTPSMSYWDRYMENKACLQNFTSQSSFIARKIYDTYLSLLR